MKRILLFSFAALVLAACGKDKFETVPKVTVKSFGPETVVKGQQFKLVAEVTDKEGDLQDTMLLVRKRFTNNILFFTDTTRISLKNFAFPNHSSIELQLIFTYGEDVPGTIFYNFQESVDRGLIYGLILSDKAKNKSEYVETPRITLKKV